MVSNATLETLSFNSFIVNGNMNDNNQYPDLNFFDESVSSSLNTDYYRQKILRVSLKIITKPLFCFTSKY